MWSRNELSSLAEVSLYFVFTFTSRPTSLLTANAACTYTGGNKEKVPQDKSSKNVSAGTTGGKYVHAWTQRGRGREGERGGREHLNSEQFVPFTFCGELFTGIWNLKFQKRISVHNCHKCQLAYHSHCCILFRWQQPFLQQRVHTLEAPFLLLLNKNVPSHTSCADLFLLFSSGSHDRKVH